MLPDVRRRHELVFASGPYGTGGTALATALSMLGYRCASDLAEVPLSEQNSLFHGTGEPVFNAYVNIGTIELVLPNDHRDKWQLLSDFLGFDYPAHAYPMVLDRTARTPLRNEGGNAKPVTPMRWLTADRSP